MYMGEVARRLLRSLAETTQLFGGRVPLPPALETDYAFPTSAVATIVEDDSPWLSRTAAVLEERLGVAPGATSHSGRKTVQQVCTLVARRSALVVAVMLDAILTHTGWKDVPARTVVAFDGGVYDHFTRYRAMLREELEAVMGERAQALSPLVEFTAVHDGSCLGAAVLAAAAEAAAAAATTAEVAAAK